jgi:hypothetical protein
MLLNIDKPNRTATLHADSCRQVPDPLGTQLKPVGAIGRDGGWFQVESRSQAESTVEREVPGLTLVHCSWC